MTRLGIRVEGVKEAEQAFRELPRRIENKHMRVAMNAGGGVIKPVAASLAPDKSGTLRKSMRVKVKKSRKLGWYAAVGPRRGIQKTVRLRGITKSGKSIVQIRKNVPSRYAHLVEGGSRRHEVTVQTRRSLATVVNGEWVAYGRRVYVSSRPQRFMEKAARIAGPAAQSKVVQKLKTAVATEAYSLSRR